MSEEKQEKKLTGFALYPENINAGGRPKGSKNKKTQAVKRAEKGLMEVQDKFLDSVRMQYAIMVKDDAVLRRFNIDPDDVDVKMQMKASDAINAMLIKTPDILARIAEDTDKVAEQVDEKPKAAVLSLQPVKKA